MKCRNGYTLIECLATFALIGVAMTTVLVAMSGLQRACQRVREQTVDEMNLQRLRVQLRTDSHAARSAELEDAEGENAVAAVLLLELSNEASVSYTLSEALIRREHRHDGETSHWETYQLPDAYRAHWELTDDDALPVVALHLEPQRTDPGDPLPQRPVQVRAAVGALRGPQPESES